MQIVYFLLIASISSFSFATFLTKSEPKRFPAIVVTSQGIIKYCRGGNKASTIRFKTRQKRSERIIYSSSKEWSRYNRLFEQRQLD